MSVPLNTQLSNAAGIRLIAGREIQVRLRSKAFRITTLVLVVIVVLLCVIIKLLSGSSGDNVGYLSQDKALAQQLPSVGSSVGQTINPKAVADEATGRQEV